MKLTNLIICLVILIFVSPKIVQGEPKWEGGLKIGLGISTVFGDSASYDVEAKKELMLSGIISYPLGRGDWFAIQSEHILCSKGWSSPISNESVQHGYWNISILGKFMWPGEKRIKPTFSIGPYIGMMFPTLSRETVTTNLDYGLASGLGIDILIKGTTKLLLTVQNTMGWNNIIKKQDIKYSQNSFMIGFQF